MEKQTQNKQHTKIIEGNRCIMHLRYRIEISSGFNILFLDYEA
jgi:hypothetical protein